jgi:pilus assembly protein CpaE
VRSGPGKVIAVMAGKGGSGKTVTATNLAIAIGMRSDPERVAIVDADLQFGDVALLLQLDPVRTLDDVVGHVDSMSDERLDAALLRHESGIRVLPAPLLPVRAGEISAKSVVEVVDRLRSMFDTIVVDTGPVFDDGLITMLEHADQVISVVDMDLPSVKNAKVALDGLRQIGFDMDRIRLVVNRVNSKARLDLVELERSLGLRVGGSIPSDRLVPQSVNEGIPVLALSPRSKVARAFHALAESMDASADRERITSR